MVRKGPFYWVSISCGIMVLAFILLPLVELLTAPSGTMLKETLRDKNVIRSIWLSIYTAMSAAGISFIVGTPLAYVLARSQFRGKHFIESIIDLPIVIPHPVVGIAILSVAGKNHWLGHFMQEIGIRIMGSTTGIITVLTFVGMPFYINALKSGFEAISPRLENVSRSLGASMWSTFYPHYFSPCLAECSGGPDHVLRTLHQRVWSRRCGGLSSHDRSGAHL